MATLASSPELQPCCDPGTTSENPVLGTRCPVRTCSAKLLPAPLVGCAHTHKATSYLPLCYSVLLSAQISLPPAPEAARDTCLAPELKWQIPESPQSPSVLGIHLQLVPCIPKYMVGFSHSPSYLPTSLKSQTYLISFLRPPDSGPDLHTGPQAHFQGFLL